MVFDIIFVAILAAFTLLGLYRGIIRQLFALIALVAIWFYFRFFSFSAAAFVASHSKLSDVPAYVTALVVGVVIIYVFFALMGFFVARLARPKEGVPEKSHNLLRMFLGLVRGFLVAGFLSCIIDMLPARALDAMPAMRSALEQSMVLKVVSVANPLSDFRFLADSDLYVRVLKDEKAQEALQKQKPVIELANSNDVRELINDPEVRQLIRDRRILRLLNNPKVQRALDSDEVRALLNQIDPQAALDAAKRDTK